MGKQLLMDKGLLPVLRLNFALCLFLPGGIIGMLYGTVLPSLSRVGSERGLLGICRFRSGAIAFRFYRAKIIGMPI